MLRQPLLFRKAAGACRTSTLSAGLRLTSVRSQSTSTKYFDKILIANRGEIACRVIRTAKRLGIKTVAVYSDADARAMHVRQADEAVYIGPSPSSESYLLGDRIIAAMKATGAQAVHPGYGFLSENTNFCDKVEKAGMVFIGPKAFAINAMGDKIESKLLAISAKVNVIPGDNEILETIDQVLKVAEKIGYPVMIKASAGGGGKGMRIAYNKEEAIEGFRLSKQEAKASFGDDRIFVEKFIEEPRHVEIQLIGDAHGNCLYLPERECSIQRRNQKVIEEAPSMAVSREVHAEMGKQAVQLAKAVKYQSAGTVEFLVDKHQNFYFLEMNTRLQVEHPITEWVSGLDLVELMIMVAAGHKLPLTQAQVQCKGWALESRVYAENPLSNYLPSIGTLVKYVEPPGTIADGVRIDTGVCEGSEISMFYDPMISKLVTYGKDRNEAIARMKTALDSYVIRGVDHNICLLRDVIEDERFVSGKVTTKYLQEQYPKGFEGHKLTKAEHRELLAVVAALQTRLQARQDLIGFDAPPSGAKHLLVGLASDGNAADTVSDAKDERCTRVIVHSAGDSDGALSVEIDGSVIDVKMPSLPAPSSLLRVSTATQGGACKDVILQIVQKKPRSFVVQYMGTNYEVSVDSPLQARLQEHMPVKTAVDTSKMLLSPMPGKLVSIAVKVGDKVAPGQELVVVEAMKMQNVLKSHVGAVVKKIHFKQGDTLASADIILDFE